MVVGPAVVPLFLAEKGAKVEDDEAEWNVNGIQLFTDSSQQIQLYADANNTSQKIEVMTMGYFLPGGM